MIRVKKNGKRMEISSAAFHNFYKSAGWEIDGSVVVIEKQVEPSSDEYEEDAEEDEWNDALSEEEGFVEIPDDVEKPISQMNHSELIEKAIRVGVDVSDNPSNAKLRDRIRNA